MFAELAERAVPHPAANIRQESPPATTLRPAVRNVCRMSAAPISGATSRTASMNAVSSIPNLTARHAARGSNRQLREPRPDGNAAMHSSNARINSRLSSKGFVVFICVLLWYVRGVGGVRGNAHIRQHRKHHGFRVVNAAAQTMLAEFAEFAESGIYIYPFRREHRKLVLRRK